MSRALLLPALTCALLGAALLGVAVGAYPIPPSTVGAILLQKFHIHAGPQPTAQQEAVLWAVRLPRVALGALVGAGLGVAGAAMQGVFRNPLADPGLCGVQGGAALGAASVIVLGARLGGALPAAPWLLQAAAFGGALAATAATARLGRVDGRTSVATLLLAGVALNALGMAGVGFLTYLATDVQARTLTFWSLGSLGGASWALVGTAAPLLLGPLLLLPRSARALDALLLGEAEAMHLGYRVESLKRRALLLVALSVGASVAVAGVVSFVGLVVPSLLRLLAGPSHRRLLPGAALLGAALLLLADVAARTAVAPAELPLGVVTALLGAPFFLALLLRERRRLA